VAGDFEEFLLTKRKAILTVGAIILGTVPLIACGSDHSALPTAPASVVVAPAAAVAIPFEIAISGGRLSAQQHSGTEAGATSLTVASIVSGTACPALTFMIGPYVIKTDAATSYSGGGCANIQAGTKLGLMGILSNDTQLLFYATRVTLERNDPTPVSGESRVASVVSTTSCPTLSFMLGPYAVTTSAATVFANGTCANLVVGAEIRLTGVKGDVSILATTITFKETPTEKHENAEGEGVITSLSSGTACPALTFMIGSYAIKTAASTVFENGACSGLKAGLRVHVKGTVNSDGSVGATLVRIQHEAPHQEAEGDGVVTGAVAGSTCPTLKFRVGDYTVVTDAATQFLSGRCSDIAPGRKVHVKGSMTDDKTVAATSIGVKG
jgi:hypothetical protein